VRDSERAQNARGASHADAVRGCEQPSPFQARPPSPGQGAKGSPGLVPRPPLAPTVALDNNISSGARMRPLPDVPGGDRAERGRTMTRDSPYGEDRGGGRPGLPPLPTPQAGSGSRSGSNQPSPRPGGGGSGVGGGRGGTTEEQLRAALLAGRLVQEPPKLGSSGGNRGGGGPYSLTGGLSGRRPRSPGRGGSRDLTPRRIGPRLPGDFLACADDVSLYGGWPPRVAEVAVLSTQTVGKDTTLLYLSPQIICVQWGTPEALARTRNTRRANASASVWATARPQKTESVQLSPAEQSALLQAGRSISLFMQQRHPGRHMAVISDPEVATKVNWQGNLQVIEVNDFEPRPLSVAEDRVREVLRYMGDHRENVVLFFQPDIALVACIMAMTNVTDLNSAFVKMCEIAKEDQPLAGCARYLAALHELCQQSPGLSLYVYMYI